MKWRKIGKIFDPTLFQFPFESIGFAQSPQAVVHQNFVRIYFSTRTQDSEGKYLSVVSFADFDNFLTKVISISKDLVIRLGDLGSFDEHGIFPFSPIRRENKILAYTCGWSRRASVSVETSIGLAASQNGGLSFEKLGQGPILSSAINEPFLVGDAFVRWFNNSFHMWYIYGTKWKLYPGETEPDRVYKIAHAVSLDGIHWSRDGIQIIEDKTGIEECQALPTVIKIGDRFHMIFCYRAASGFRSNKKLAYRIGYAYSTDLIHWSRDDKQVGIDVSEDGWDSDMLCYPHLFDNNGRILLLYNGNQFGRYGFGLAEMIQD